MQTDEGLPTAVVEHEALNPAADSEVATRPLVLLDDLCRVHGNSHDIPGLCPAVFHSRAAQRHRAFRFRGSPTRPLTGGGWDARCRRR